MPSASQPVVQKPRQATPTQTTGVLVSGNQRGEDKEYKLVTVSKLYSDKALFKAHLGTIP